MVTFAPKRELGKDKDLKQFRVHQAGLDQLKKHRLTRLEFLREQILRHDRIDLLMNEVLGYKAQDFHLAMYQCVRHNALKIANLPGQSQTWNLTLAGRGFGKSTVLTVSRCILEMLKNPNIRILIASKTDDNAVAFLSEIKQKLVKKELVELFGRQQGAPWNDGNIRIHPRTSEGKEDTVQTVGIGGALASRHFDLIVADDLIDENNSNTEGQREKIVTWFFKVLDPCLEPNGEMSLIGTRYHPHDLLGYLIEHVFTVRDDDGRPLKKHYRNFPSLLATKGASPLAAANRKFTSLWPEKFGVEFLLKKRETLGTIIFNSQYQNDVEGMKGKIFKIDWFQWCRREQLNLGELKIFQGVDLAIKQSDRADKFAHVTIGIDPKTKNIYVLDRHNAVTHYNDQKRVIKQMFLKYDPIRVAIESNGYQRSLLQDMRADSELAMIRAIPEFTDKDKHVRAWKLSAYFERRQVYFVEGMTDLMEQLLLVPDGRYMDLFDALDIAVRCAFRGVRRLRDGEPGLI